MRGLRACKVCSLVKVSILLCERRIALFLFFFKPPVHLWPLCTSVVSLQILRQNFDQFLYSGCENCERYLKLKGDRQKVNDCTSPNFDGWASAFWTWRNRRSKTFLLRVLCSSPFGRLISMLGPEDSWVAKWQRIGIVCNFFFCRISLFCCAMSVRPLPTCMCVSGQGLSLAVMLVGRYSATVSPLHNLTNACERNYSFNLTSTPAHAW